MIQNDELLSLLKKKYVLNKILIHNDSYKLFSFGKETDKNYIILKDNLCSNDELIKVQAFIDSLAKKKIKNASFVLIAFVNNDYNSEDYIGFNGNVFLHTITYNLISSACIYDKSFYYCGSKKIKQLLADIEQIFNSI